MANRLDTVALGRTTPIDVGPSWVFALSHNPFSTLKG